MLTRQELTTGSRLFQLIELFRELDPEMQAHQISAFITIALMDGRCTKNHLAERLGVSLAATTRILQVWSNTVNRKRPGFDYVSVGPDPEKANRLVLVLNSRGRKFWSKLLDTIGESHGS